MGNQLDLLSLFSAVTGTLEENKSALNKADSYNSDHGDNMVDIFKMVTGAISNNQDEDVSTQLSAAGSLLENLQSGSAQEYAKGFQTASQQLQGSGITTESVLPLLQSLFGGGSAPESDSSLEGMLGGFLGGEDGKVDAGDLLSAGLSFLTARNKGKSTQEALIDALISRSSFGSSPHRAQSSSLVASTIFSMLGSKNK